jgi:hypothetical protein
VGRPHTEIALQELQQLKEEAKEAKPQLNELTFVSWRDCQNRFAGLEISREDAVQSKVTESRVSPHDDRQPLLSERCRLPFRP